MSPPHPQARHGLVLEPRRRAPAVAEDALPEEGRGGTQAPLVVEEATGHAGATRAADVGAEVERAPSHGHGLDPVEPLADGRRDLLPDRGRSRKRHAGRGGTVAALSALTACSVLP